MWPQTIVFCLHSIAMSMKIFSYTSYNRHLEGISRRLLLLSKEKPVDGSTVGVVNPEEVAQLHTELFYQDDAIRVVYPENLTLWNFIDFLLVPTFVYQLGYPREKSP